MSTTRLEELKSLIARLQADRQAHVDAIAQIDESFGALGIHPQIRKRGRLRGAPLPATKTRRPRRKFRTTGTESVLAFVKAAGPKGVTGGQIVQHWKTEGRGDTCYHTLRELIKAKKIKRQKMKGQKGSAYTAG